MYTPRLNSRRWFGARNVPATRSDNGQSATSPMVQLHDEIDRLFDGMFRGMMNPWDFDFMPRRTSPDQASATTDVAVMPRLDVSSDEKTYTVSAELPGVKPEDVKLEVRDNALILHGEKKDEIKEEKKDYYVSERSYGSFERVLTLPEDAVVDEIKASHKDGVLTISIPRREPEKPQSKTIEISQE